MSLTRSFADPDDLPLGHLLKANPHPPSPEQIEFALTFENPVESRRRDLQNVASRDQLSVFDQILRVAGHLLAVLEGDSLGSVDHELDHASTAAILQGNLDEVQAGGLGGRLQGPEKLFPIDVRSPRRFRSWCGPSKRKPPGAPGGLNVPNLGISASSVKGKGPSPPGE